jgi:hypothetical protein
MSGNVIPVGNTPIFDQLVREMALRGVRYESLIADGPIGLLPVPSFLTPSSWIARPIPRILPEEKPKMVDTFSLCELEDQAISFDLHISKLVDKFTGKFPDVSPVHITRMDNTDGTITIVVSKAEMVEQTDESVNADHTPDVVKPLSEVLENQSPDMITARSVKTSFLDPETIDPRYRQTSIGEDTAEALYMKASTWGSDEE